MPRPTDERARVLGPYWHEGRKQWRVIAIHTPTAARAKDRESTFYYPTEDEAIEAKQQLEEQLSNVTLEMAINAYEQHLKAKQTIGYHETIRRLRLFFPDLTMLVGR